MTSSSGHTSESDCDMRDNNTTLMITSQGTHVESNQTQAHIDLNAKKRKVTQTERLCVTCNGILFGPKTLCECCAGCCNSAECRASEHLLAKAVKKREAQVEDHEEDWYGC